MLLVHNYSNLLSSLYFLSVSEVTTMIIVSFSSLRSDKNLQSVIRITLEVNHIIDYFFHN